MTYKKPKIYKSSAKKIFRYILGSEEAFNEFDCLEIAVRMPKINLFDDELGVLNVKTDEFVTFNWNADPSKYRIGKREIAILKTGFHRFKMSFHHIGRDDKRYVGLRPDNPNSELPVWRRRLDGSFYSSTGYGINQHAGAELTTGSEGCQTAPKSQYPDFIRSVGKALGVEVPLGIITKKKVGAAVFDKFYKGFGKIGYCLLTQEQFDYIMDLDEKDFDSKEDLQYQMKNFVGLPKVQTIKPTIEKRDEILAQKVIAEENIFDSLSDSSPDEPSKSDSESEAEPIADSGSASQQIENQINVGRDEAKIDVAQESDPIVIEGTKKVGFFGKIWSIILGVLTGTYALPSFDLSESQIELIKAVLPYIVIALVFAVCWYYFVKKQNNFKITELLVKTNADPTKKDVVIESLPRTGILEKIKESNFASAFSSFCLTLLLFFLARMF